ncbi:MAG: HAMP domain-containing histidine kinase [Blastocatellia bacterium]|nr:HAMP domain-containing histidine kinase [Blastocatellia bacterium]
MSRDTESLSQELLLHSKTFLLGSIIPTLVHDLNNPLTSISGNIELLQMSSIAEDAKIKKRLDTVQTGAKRMIERLRALQLFIKNSSADEVFSLNSLVQDTVTVADFLPKRLKLSANLFLSEKKLECRGNSNQIAQALLAIIDNALFSALESETPIVDVSTFDTSGLAVVQVKNNGAEIESGVGERMFKPFFSTKPESLGLGLYISRQYVEANGGSINWKNEDGWVVFKLSFPIVSN